MLLKTCFLLVLVPLVLAGCGSGGPVAAVAPGASKLAQSQQCMSQSCHGTMESPGTGALIVDEWTASTHNTKNGAGCADCHEPDAGHPNLCNKCHGGGGFGVVRNPDQAGKCGKCHGLQFPNDVMVALAPKHFGNMTASFLSNNYRASYVSSNYPLNNCSKCHNPHDTSSAHQVNADWAASGHGNVTKARTNYDFKTRGTYQPVNLTFQYYCVRCHTSTGFIRFASSGFTDMRPFAGPGFIVVQNAPVKVPPGAAQPVDAPSPDKTKEATNCDVCHDDGNGRAYGWKVRDVAPFTVYYNFSSANSSPTIRLNNKPVSYPDAGDSNVCIPCHAGRGIGSMVYDAAALGMDFSNTNAPGAHDRAAAATIFQKGGFEFQGRDYSNPAFQHQKTGMANFNGTGTHGPCVTCHMSGDHTHSFSPVTISGGTITDMSPACFMCHNGVKAATFPSPAYLQEKKTGFAAALAVLNKLRAGKVQSLPSRNSNYNAVYPGGGMNTMGAVFNYGYLANDTGAFAHNPLYTKRLLWDSIDWIDNGVMDNDVVAAINAIPVAGTITDATKAAAIKFLTTDASGNFVSGRP